MILIIALSKNLSNKKEKKISAGFIIYSIKL